MLYAQAIDEFSIPFTIAQTNEYPLGSFDNFWQFDRKQM